jgi:hypothetical protein
VAGPASFLQAEPQQGRLSDPGLAPDDECMRTGRDGSDERIDPGQLAGAAEDGRGVERSLGLRVAHAAIMTGHCVEGLPGAYTATAPA